jgi:transcriptional regulator NrdR family protein
MTRPADEGVYRRHRCAACGEAFISLEVVVAGAKAIPKHAELQTQMKARHANRTA